MPESSLIDFFVSVSVVGAEAGGFLASASAPCLAFGVAGDFLVGRRSGWVSLPVVLPEVSELLEFFGVDLVDRDTGVVRGFLRAMI